MNPVPVMKLVEVIKGLTTSQETFDITWELCEKLERHPLNPMTSQDLSPTES